MKNSDITFGQKLAEATKLIKEAGKQLEEFGLKLDFQLTIKAQIPTISFEEIERLANES